MRADDVNRILVTDLHGRKAGVRFNLCDINRPAIHRIAPGGQRIIKKWAGPDFLFPALSRGRSSLCERELRFKAAVYRIQKFPQRVLDQALRSLGHRSVVLKRTLGVTPDSMG